MGRKFIIFLSFVIFLLCAITFAKYNPNREVMPLCREQICSDARFGDFEIQASIQITTCFVVSFLNVFSFVAISFITKTYLWKAVLPVFWGAKYRMQSPRCKLY